MPNAVPTRDISVAWAAEMKRPTVGGAIDREFDHLQLAVRRSWFDHQQHRLLQSGATFESATCPVKYKAFPLSIKRFDAEMKVGVKTTPAIKRFDADASGIVSVQERKRRSTRGRATSKTRNALGTTNLLRVCSLGLPRPATGCQSG